MINKIKDFVAEQAKIATEQVQKFSQEPGQAVRDATVKSAQRIRSLKDPVRAFSRSGVKLTAISQGTAQSLIELQAEMVTTALTEAAAQLERVAKTQDVRELVRDQAGVLRATRERIVNDLGQAVGIFKDAGGGLRDVATHTYSSVAGKTRARPATARTAKSAKTAKTRKARR